MTGVSCPHISQYAEVAAGAEGASRSCQHDRAHCIIVSSMTQRVYKRLAEFDV